jgi:hypothetical protein
MLALVPTALALFAPIAPIAGLPAAHAVAS